MNQQATKKQVLDAKQAGQRIILLHEHDNRQRRRLKDDTGRILNNRKNPRKRAKVLERMPA